MPTIDETVKALLDDPKERVQRLEVAEVVDRGHRFPSDIHACLVRWAKSAKLIVGGDDAATLWSRHPWPPPGGGVATIAGRSPMQQICEPRLWLSSYNRRWYGGEVGIADALLGAAREIFADHEDPGGVWITDSLFPGFFWLLGREWSTNLSSL